MSLSVEVPSHVTQSFGNLDKLPRVKDDVGMLAKHAKALEFRGGFSKVTERRGAIEQVQIGI
jgi:hypothetical protein